MTGPVHSAIAIGSNLGDRRATVESALLTLDALPESRLLKVSDVIETDPVGPIGQPKYLNAVAVVETTLPPRTLLESMLRIEKEHGRDRTREARWGPRTLDLDLLLHGNEIVEEEGLRVPHPRLHERLFVLHPLAAVMPEVIHPTLGVTIHSLLLRLQTAQAIG